MPPSPTSCKYSRSLLRSYHPKKTLFVCLCVEVLRPSQPNGVISSIVSLSNHSFTGQAQTSKRLTSFVNILLPEADNCPSWISERERMTIEYISWLISTKKCCQLVGVEPATSWLPIGRTSNWAMEASSQSSEDPDQIVQNRMWHLIRIYTTCCSFSNFKHISR